MVNPLALIKVTSVMLSQGSKWQERNIQKGWFTLVRSLIEACTWTYLITGLILSFRYLTPIVFAESVPFVIFGLYLTIRSYG